jgi:hypothetical protein
MALKKLETFGSKTGEYWKILGVYPDSMHLVSKVRVALYKDQPSRDKDEASYVYSKYFTIPGANSARDSAYQALKALVDFEGAEDC